MTDKELRQQIIDSVWPYGKPDPIEVVLSRGLDKRYFQMPMNTFVKSLEALITTHTLTARQDELKYLLEDFGIEDNVQPIKKRINELNRSLTKGDRVDE